MNQHHVQNIRKYWNGQREQAVVEQNDPKTEPRFVDYIPSMWEWAIVTNMWQAIIDLCVG